MTIEEKITQTVNGKLSDGTFERLISEKLDESIKKALDDVLGYGGEVRKLLSNKINEVMIPAIERHDFNQYLVKLDSVLTEIINNTSLADNKSLLESFKELMTEPKLKEIKISEIFRKYCEYVAADVDTDNLEAECEDGDPYYSHVTARMEVERERDSWGTYDHCEVKFSCEEDENLNYQIRLFATRGANDWRIIEGAGDSIDMLSLRNMNQFQVFMCVLHRGFTSIVIDEDNDCDDDIEPDATPEWSLS